MLLHQLEVFLQVAEKNSFTKAAEALFLSQSTVSAHISNLEKNFVAFGRGIHQLLFGISTYFFRGKIQNKLLKNRKAPEIRFQCVTNVYGVDEGT